VTLAAVMVSDPLMLYVAMVYCACVSSIMISRKPETTTDTKKQAFMMKPQIPIRPAYFQPK
jgi:hypothetical protein